MPSRYRPHPALQQLLAYPLPQPRRVRQALAVGLALVLALQLGWVVALQPPWWRMALAVALWGAAAAGSGWMPLWPTGAALCWSGARWQLVGEDVAHLGIAMDGQAWLLLRARLAGGAARWLLLTRASAPQRWPALRRVLYSSLAA